MRAPGTVTCAVRPGARAVRRHADGEVEVEADAHAGGERARRAPRRAGGRRAIAARRGSRPRRRAPRRRRATASVPGSRNSVGPAVPAGAVALLRHALRERLEQGVQLERLRRRRRGTSRTSVGVAGARVAEMRKSAERCLKARDGRGSRRARRRAAAASALERDRQRGRSPAACRGRCRAGSGTGGWRARRGCSAPARPGTARAAG